MKRVKIGFWKLEIGFTWRNEKCLLKIFEVEIPLGLEKLFSAPARWFSG